MNEIKTGSVPSVFDNMFERLNHSHPKCFSNTNYIKPKIKLKRSRF